MRMYISRLLLSSVILISACREEQPERPQFADEDFVPHEDAVTDESEQMVQPLLPNTEEAKLEGGLSLASDEDKEKSSAPASEGKVQKFQPVFKSLYMTTEKNKPLVKGVAFTVRFNFGNQSDVEGEFKFTPKLSSTEFTDFEDFSLEPIHVKLAPRSSKTVAVQINPYITDSQTGAKFALAPGRYYIGSKMEYNGETKNDKRYFVSIGKSTAVFTLVLVGPKHFDRLPVQDIQTYLKETYTRPLYVENPATKERRPFPGGFDELVGTNHLFDLVSGYNSHPGEDKFVTARSLAEKALGMSKKWHSLIKPQDSHGYDYIIALHDNQGGTGVTFRNIAVVQACSNSLHWQELMLHESGHVFGAGHVSGSYVMNPIIQRLKTLVWTKATSQQLTNRFIPK